MKYGIKIVGPIFPTPKWVVIDLKSPTKIYAEDDINVVFGHLSNMTSMIYNYGYTFQVLEISEEEIQNGEKAYQ